MALPGNSFSGSTNIITIDISSNCLSNLSANTFADQNALEYLSLSVNNIDDLPDKLFYHTISLRILKLDKNRIEKIPSGLFSRLNKLEYLELRFNKIKSIEGTQFIGLASLKTLNLSDNNLATLKMEMENSSSKAVSVLQYNFELADLQLAHNSLSEMYTDWVVTLVNLSVINLSSNKFNTLQIGTFNSSSGGRNIDLSNNSITSVHFDFAQTIHDEKVTLKLDNNPFHCDGNLLSFVQYVQQFASAKKKTLFKNLKCNTPSTLEGKVLSKIDYKLLTNEIKNSELYNNCPVNCTCHYRPIDKGHLINCQNVGLQKLPPSLPTYNNANHTELNLTKNHLETIEIQSNKGYDVVTHFYLADNNATHVYISTNSNILKVMDLSNNNLEYLPEETIHFLEAADKLESLLLEGNPWRCDCDSKSFIKLLKNMTNQVHNISSLVCANGGKSFEEVEVSGLCPVSHPVLLVAVVFVFMGILMISMMLCHCYTTEIQILCFRSKLLSMIVSRPDDENMKYDAFVSYAEEDEGFVTRQLVPYLEETGEIKYKICLHFREWLGGEIINEKIIESVHNSRRTIVVLSQHFLNSGYCLFEFKIAHSKAINDQKSRVIPIMFEQLDMTQDFDKDLKAYIKTNTYMKWGSPSFWHQLNYAMPHPGRSTDSTSPLVKSKQKIDQKKSDHIELRNRELLNVVDKPGKIIETVEAAISSNS